MCVEEQHTELPVHVMSSATNKKSDVLAKKKKKKIPEYFLLFPLAFQKERSLVYLLGCCFIFPFPLFSI